MTSKEHSASHLHGQDAHLSQDAAEILTKGLRQLLDMTRGLEFKDLPSQRCPLPLRAAVYRRDATPDEVRRDVEERLESDPVSVLEGALVLLELFECNQADTGEHILADGPFTGACFQSKRLNGWVACMGDCDAVEVEAAVNERWQFRFFNGPVRETGVYVILSMLARYGFVYGKVARGDMHALGHFVEDFTPGVLVCRGRMSELELTLSLAAMKMGVPAVVPVGYPFPYGRTLEADSLADVAEAVVGFPNVRRLLAVPGLPQLPDYCDEANMDEKFEPAAVWGDTPESFYILRKGAVDSPGRVVVTGEAKGALGVIVTAEAEPLDVFDRSYIERTIATALLMVKGVMASYDGRRLKLRLREAQGFDPARIGEVLLGALRNEFPKIKKVSAEVILDDGVLSGLSKEVAGEKDRRAQEIATASEESIEQFATCVGCSPFAPDHVCILTPERPPMCGRQFEQVKAGALYAFDDMSNIHHSSLHRDINSFGVVDKGQLLDAEAGEWSGVNARAAKLSGGRTPRVLLHSLDDNPHTGCGCFRLVMFKTDKPGDGIGVMDAGYEGSAPDGRSWRDLHYSLSGKQTPGISGASPVYLKSAKFLAAHGGWQAVVWVSPKIAAIMAGDLPGHVEVGAEIPAAD